MAISNNDSKPGGDLKHWSIDEQDALRYKDRLYVPPESSIRQEILRLHHDHEMAGHFGSERTLELVKRHYY